MILRLTEQAIQKVLSESISDALQSPNAMDFYLSDADETKLPMPYILVQCVDSEELVTPNSGIFRVMGELIYRAHTKATSPEERNLIVDLINQFSYSNTADQISSLEGFHAYGWEPTQGVMTVDDKTKSVAYSLKFNVYCIPRDNT